MALAWCARAVPLTLVRIADERALVVSALLRVYALLGKPLSCGYTGAPVDTSWDKTAMETATGDWVLTSSPMLRYERSTVA